MAKGPFQKRADGLEVAVRLQPGASREAIEGTEALVDGRVVLKVRVGAPPEDGKANAALVKLLAKGCGVPKSAVTVLAGHRHRFKRVLIVGNPKALRDRLVGADRAPIAGKGR